MTSRRSRAIALAAAIVVVAAIGYLGARRARMPGPGSPAYDGSVRAFYHGFAALQVGLLDDAKAQFGRGTELVPREPAAWANLGVAHLRLGEFDQAAMAIARAAALAGDDSRVALLQGQLEAARGRFDEAIAAFRRAVSLDANNIRARDALAQQIENGGGPDADTEAGRLYEDLLGRRPQNLAVLLERTRLAARRGDKATLADSVERLQRVSSDWPAAATAQLAALKQASTAPNATDVVRAAIVLRNVLVRMPIYREGLAELRTPAELIAEPFDRFLRLEVPSSAPSPPDDGLSFATISIHRGDSLAGSSAPEVVAVSMDGVAQPTTWEVRADSLRPVVGPGAGVPLTVQPSIDRSASSVVALDWNRDYKMDFAVAGKRGVQLLVQDASGALVDATSQASAAGGAVTAECLGVWAADIEMDGDLDLIVGVAGEAPVVLRNNGNGTWQQMRPFAGVTGARAFAWGDLDGDGDPDAAFIDAAGNLKLFANRQAGRFDAMTAPPASTAMLAVALGDVDGDGGLDLVTLDSAGAIRRASFERGAWRQEQVATWMDHPDTPDSAGRFRLLLGDIDNNGALDIVVSGARRSRAWLGNERGTFQPLKATLEAEVTAIADLDGDGQLDFVGVNLREPVRLIGRGTKGYHWQVLRPRAQPTAGDQRINSFGVGGEVEIRSGLLVERQVIGGPIVHFGLGTRTGVDVARILWPNGIVQADFDTKADETVLTEQRLKGSCPWVFADNGHGMQFVTDFLWRSPLGLRINAQDTAGVSQTEDWVKIRGSQLAARNGAYDVRITAELWETHFIDHVSLLAVDHPADVDVFVDERFLASSPPALTVHTTAKPAPIRQAWDDSGRDVTAMVANDDGRYAATFARGPFQGIATDHFIDVDLGTPVSVRERMWLIAKGWIYPTDSSINVAIAQAGIRPRGVALEVRDDRSGRWLTIASDLGFPAGKNKTMLIDLAAAGRAGLSEVRRLRLRTNLEIYWDWLAVAKPAPEGSAVVKRLTPSRAELRYRGFSKTTDARSDRPETPSYGELANVAERWRDLSGYYTRFGDVRELVEQVDDRYVIMNAGDELRLSFVAPEAPRSGWTRDFVLAGDGWEKDGDYNTSFSDTVLPLPSHDRPNYGGDVEATHASHLPLEADPVYLRHAEDWQTYHTRFVAPGAFLRGLSH